MFSASIHKALAGLIIILVSGLAACAHEPVPAAEPASVVAKEVASPTDLERRLAGLINEERGRHYLRPLSYSPHLARTAESHSRDMAHNRFFSHNNAKGQGPEERLNRDRYPWRAYGENIGCGQDSPDKILARWMRSAGHRENILNPVYSEIGIGFVRGGECRTYWTGLFATPKNK